MVPLLNNLVLLTAAAGAVTASSKPVMLAPKNDIRFPASATAKEPLKHVGANGPYFAGPNVNKISSDVPANCKVDRAAYASRHGSRYPDNGAYNGWVDMYTRFQAGNFTATGPLAFLKDWQPVLTDPANQIAMESVTGWKEAYDMGYTLRTRYPQLYDDGTPFYTWANNYTRVIQTARNFARGFLGPRAEELGSVVSVTSKGSVGAMGNSLAPADQCSAFDDNEGDPQTSVWNAVYIPPIQARLQALITGDLQLTTNDISQIPYLCGFESQITGRLSPWCSVFTDAEFLDYEYFQDLRYYYGLGNGNPLGPVMMMPFLDSLLGLMARDNATGIDAAGAPFDVPKLLTVFINDGQLSELVAASGVFDAVADLPADSRDPNRLFVSSRYTCMRGGIAFERMTCRVPNTPSSADSCQNKNVPLSDDESHEEVFMRIKLNDAVYPLPSCKSGPGASCKFSDYQKYVADKYAAQGNWVTNCNNTEADAPTKVQGASFFTDLSSAWIVTEAA
ncbi:hypothetical protein TD95_004269 [Thielaviopsis punctulata]|uniref:3-phytase n=1 Tax=Thielaviopsis punctulata TaxID=72032 RepID=A0A0F4ZBF9_9PEZI|nr:hypothetical protein TD95_004269 [Thielaviopsis punctulata]